MRVAFLSIHGYVDPNPNLGLVDTGGQVVYVIEMAKKLGLLGIKVDIYTRLFNNRKNEEIVSKNVRIIRIPCGPDSFLRKEDLFPYLDEYAENLIGYIDSNGLRYDLFHTHYWDAGYVGLKLRNYGYRIIHTSHSLGLIKKMLLGKISEKVDYKFDVRIKVERDILENADVLVSASPVEQSYVERLYGVKRDMHCVPPGVDTKYFDPKKARPIDLPKKYIFSTGRFEWTKGFDLLVKAFVLVSKRQPDVKLVLGGGSEKPTELELDVRKEIERIAKRKGIADRVIQTGRIPNSLLPTYYARSRIVILPSRYDLFGMVAIEGLASARPVVVSKYAGVSRYISGDFGFIVDPNDEEEFSEKMLYLLENPSEADTMGQFGRKYVIETFDWDVLAKKLLSIYQHATSVSLAT